VIGRSISHYRVLSTLGSGGMGVVYLAEDERLGRQVALKFLPADSVTNRQALDRFRVEARAASSLSHPGICAIFDIGDDQGTPYIVMEVLKGESLRDRINRGPMKVADLLEIGIQLADALDAAHAQGIIHRDIKPSNIFVGEKNRTKILDFGLAKLTQSAAPPSSGGMTRLDASTHRDLTMPGSALGTVSYMSPEQARGEEVDTRTDLFSLGVVLYEMATGVQAFGGSTQAVVFDAILNRTPQPITHINPMIPPRLDALIATALEKERDLRQQHASDLEAELKRLRRDLESGSIAASSLSRTVVLPPSERRSASMSAAPKTEPAPRVSWMWIAAAVLALVALVAVGFRFWPRTEPDSLQVSNTPTPPAISAPPSASLGPAPPPAQSTTPEPVALEARPPETAVPVRPGPQPQPQTQAARSTAEPRPQATQPSVTPTPQRPPANGSTPGTITLPAPAPTPSTAPAPQQTTEAPSPSPVQTAPPPPAPVQSQPAPPAAEPPPVQPTRPAVTAAPAPSIPPSSPVESDDAAIRGVIRTYERAIETKSIDLFRSVRPGLSANEERVLRNSFSQADSQQVDIVIEELRIEGRMATVRLSRRDTIVNGGRRQTVTSRQTLRMEKAAAGWIITAIIGQ
jgi:serine/threonine protein kinase